MKILRTFLILSLVLLLTGCALPEVTPQAASSTPPLPTTTAPVVPTVSEPTETPSAVNELITAKNAASLAASERTGISNVLGMTWSLDSKSLMLFSQNSSNGTDQVFSIASLAIPSLNTNFVWAAQAGTHASPDGKTVAVISADNTQVNLVDASTGSKLKTLQPGYAVMMATFSPDGKTLAVTSQEDWQMILYDVATGQELLKLTGFETAAPVYDAGFAGSNQWLVWHARATIQLQSTADGTMVPPFEHEDFVSAFSLTADGKLLASASIKTLDGKVKPIIYLWDTSSGKFIRALVLDNPATALAFSPDGSLLAVAEGNAIQIWDVANEAVLATLTENTNPVYLLAFSPDGKILASSGNDNQLILWTVVK